MASKDLFDLPLGNVKIQDFADEISPALRLLRETAPDPIPTVRIPQLSGAFGAAGRGVGARRTETQKKLEQAAGAARLATLPSWEQIKGGLQGFDALPYSEQNRLYAEFSDSYLAAAKQANPDADIFTLDQQLRTSQPPPVEPTRSWAQVATDIGSGLAAGVDSFGGSIASAVDPAGDAAVASRFRNQQRAEGRSPVELDNAKQIAFETQQLLADPENSIVGQLLGEVAIAGSNLSLSTVSELIGGLVPSLLAGGGVAGGVRYAALRRGATAVNAAVTGAKAGARVGLAIESVSTGGEAGAQAFQSIMDAPLADLQQDAEWAQILAENGGDEAAAREAFASSVARVAQAWGSVAGGLLAAVPGSLEKRIGKAAAGVATPRGLGRRAGGLVGTSFIEGATEAAAPISSNIALGVDNLLAGAGGDFALGAIAGVGGTAVTAATGRALGRREQELGKEPGDSRIKTNTDGTFTVATSSGSVTIDNLAGARRIVATMPTIDTLTGSPEPESTTPAAPTQPSILEIGGAQVSIGVDGRATYVAGQTANDTADAFISGQNTTAVAVPEGPITIEQLNPIDIPVPTAPVRPPTPATQQLNLSLAPLAGNMTVNAFQALSTATDILRNTSTQTITDTVNQGGPPVLDPTQDPAGYFVRTLGMGVRVNDNNPLSRWAPVVQASAPLAQVLSVMAADPTAGVVNQQAAAGLLELFRVTGTAFPTLSFRPRMGAGTRGGRTLGNYNPALHAIKIGVFATAKTVNHEALHALTVKGLDRVAASTTQESRDLMALMTFIHQRLRSEASGRQVYGLRDYRRNDRAEMLAELMEPTFLALAARTTMGPNIPAAAQRAIDRLNAAPTSTILEVLSRMISRILSYLPNGTMAPDSVLNMLTRAAAEFASQTAPSRPAPAAPVAAPAPAAPVAAPAPATPAPAAPVAAPAPAAPVAAPVAATPAPVAATPAPAAPVAAPAAPVAAPVAGPLAGVRTSTPVTLTLPRGTGGDPSIIYNGVQVPVAGQGTYFADTTENAAPYGSVNTHTIRLESPLVIETDSQWRYLTMTGANWPYPNISGLSEQEVRTATAALREHLLDSGYDSLVVRMDQTGDNARTLRNVFGHDQVVSYSPQVAQQIRDANATTFANPHPNENGLPQGSTVRQNPAGLWVVTAPTPTGSYMTVTRASRYAAVSDALADLSNRAAPATPAVPTAAPLGLESMPDFGAPLAQVWAIARRNADRIAAAPLTGADQRFALFDETYRRLAHGLGVGTFDARVALMNIAENRANDATEQAALAAADAQYGYNQAAATSEVKATIIELRSIVDAIRFPGGAYNPDSLVARVRALASVSTNVQARLSDEIWSTESFDENIQALVDEEIERLSTPAAAAPAAAVSQPPEQEIVTLLNSILQRMPLNARWITADEGGEFAVQLLQLPSDVLQPREWRFLGDALRSGDTQAFRVAAEAAIDRLRGDAPAAAAPAAAVGAPTLEVIQPNATDREAWAIARRNADVLAARSDMRELERSTLFNPTYDILYGRNLPTAGSTGRLALDTIAISAQLDQRSVAALAAADALYGYNPPAAPGSLGSMATPGVTNIVTTQGNLGAALGQLGATTAAMRPGAAPAAAPAAPAANNGLNLEPFASNAPVQEVWAVARRNAQVLRQMYASRDERRDLWEPIASRLRQYGSEFSVDVRAALLGWAGGENLNADDTALLEAADRSFGYDPAAVAGFTLEPTPQNATRAEAWAIARRNIDSVVASSLPQGQRDALWVAITRQLIASGIDDIRTRNALLSMALREPVTAAQASALAEADATFGYNRPATPFGERFDRMMTMLDSARIDIMNDSNDPDEYQAAAMARGEIDGILALVPELSQDDILLLRNHTNDISTLDDSQVRDIRRRLLPAVNPNTSVLSSLPALTQTTLPLETWNEAIDYALALRALVASGATIDVARAVRELRTNLRLRPNNGIDASAVYALSDIAENDTITQSMANHITRTDAAVGILLRNMSQFTLLDNIAPGVTFTRVPNVAPAAPSQGAMPTAPASSLANARLPGALARPARSFNWDRGLGRGRSRRVEFSHEVDGALYLVRPSGTSTNRERYMTWLRARGLSDAQIASLSTQVVNTVRGRINNTPLGSGITVTISPIAAVSGVQLTVPAGRVVTPAAPAAPARPAQDTPAMATARAAPVVSDPMMIVSFRTLVYQAITGGRTAALRQAINAHPLIAMMNTDQVAAVNAYLDSTFSMETYLSVLTPLYGQYPSATPNAVMPNAAFGQRTPDQVAESLRGRPGAPFRAVSPGYDAAQLRTGMDALREIVSAYVASGRFRGVRPSGALGTLIAETATDDQRMQHFGAAFVAGMRQIQNTSTDQSWRWTFNPTTGSIAVWVTEQNSTTQVVSGRAGSSIDTQGFRDLDSYSRGGDSGGRFYDVFNGASLSARLSIYNSGLTDSNVARMPGNRLRAALKWGAILNDFDRVETATGRALYGSSDAAIYSVGGLHQLSTLNMLIGEARRTLSNNTPLLFNPETGGIIVNGTELTPQQLRDQILLTPATTGVERRISPDIALLAAIADTVAQGGDSAPIIASALGIGRVLFSQEQQGEVNLTAIASAFDPTFDPAPLQNGENPLTETPEFERFFGASKVVDDTGDPLVVYRGEHGSNDTPGRLQSRLNSLTFGSREAATLYANEPNNSDDFAIEPRVLPVYLSMKNPVIDNRDDPFMEGSALVAAVGREEAVRILLRHDDAVENTNNWQEMIPEKYGRRFDSVADFLERNPDGVDDLYLNAFVVLDDAAAVDAFKAAGYDGAIHIGNGATGGELEYRVFNETQVKSATGNTGDFDATNPDIRYSTEPGVSVSAAVSNAATEQGADNLAGDAPVPRVRDSIPVAVGNIVSGKAVMPTTPWRGVMQAMARGDWAGARAQASGFGDYLNKHFHDHLSPVKRWIEAFQLPAVSIDGIVNALYTAPVRRDAHLNDSLRNGGLELRQSLADIVDAMPDMTAETVSQQVGYWLTAQWAPTGNQHLLEGDAAEVSAAQRALAQAQRVELEGQQNNLGAGQLADLQVAVRAATAELNRAIAQLQARTAAVLNPLVNVKFHGGNGVAGFNNAQARSIAAAVESRIKPAMLQKVAKALYDLNGWRLALDIQSGKTHPDVAAAFLRDPDLAPLLHRLRAAAEAVDASVPSSVATLTALQEEVRIAVRSNYVPLTGNPDTALDASLFSSGTRQPNVARDYRLQGRTSSVPDDAITATWAQVLKSASYAGWAPFQDAIAEAYTAMTTEQRVAAGIYRTTVTSGQSGPMETAIIRRRGNVTQAYRLSDESLLEAIRGANIDSNAVLMSGITSLTKLYAYAATQLNMFFAPKNWIRDSWERSELIRTRVYRLADGTVINSDEAANRMIGYTINPSTMAASGREVFGLAGKTKYDNYLKELLANGGASLFNDRFGASRIDLIDGITKERLGRRQFRAVRDAIINGWNRSFEQTPALASYMALRDMGMSAKDAAGATLDLMNFRKRGQSMAFPSAIFAFAQPAVTGGANTLSAFYNPRTGKMNRRGWVQMAGYLLTFAALQAFFRSLADEDEGGNRLDQQSELLHNSHMLIPVGNGILKFPLGFGMVRLANGMARAMIGAGTGEMTAKEALGNWITGSVTPVFSPIEAHEIDWQERTVQALLTTLTPTFLKPVMSVGLNLTPWGTPVVRDNYEQTDAFRSEQFGAGVAPEYQNIARFLRRTTGIDLAPEEVKTLIRGYPLGPLTLAVVGKIENPFQRSQGRQTTNPLVSQVYANYSNSARYFQFQEARADTDLLLKRFSVGDRNFTAEERRTLLWRQSWDDQEADFRKKKAAVTRNKSLTEQGKTSRKAEIQRERERAQILAIYNYRVITGQPAKRANVPNELLPPP